MHKPTERVLDILSVLASEKKGLSLTEISERTDIPKSTLSPIISTLNKRKFISKNSENLYNIGVNTYITGESYLGKSDLYELIKNYMVDIVDECNEICQMGILNKDEVLYIAKEEPERSIQLVSHVGKLLPIHSTALGKVLVSKYSDEEIKSLLGENLEPINERTITNIDDFIKEVHKVREDNYGCDMRETSEDIECIAIPIEKDGEIITALSISIPIYRSSKEKLEDIKNLLLKYKKDIEEELSMKKYENERLF